MNRSEAIKIVKKLGAEYNDPAHFECDPIIFPKHFCRLMCCDAAEDSAEDAAGDTIVTFSCAPGNSPSDRSATGTATGTTGTESHASIRLPVPENYKVTLQDVEIAAVIAAHLAWGRRDMIVRDTKRALDEMKWKPLEYVMSGTYRSDETSLHRTVKWSEFASICNNLRIYYTKNRSLEPLSADEIRVAIYGQKSNPSMPNKKIHMLRRWFVRNDGIVDLGLWHTVNPCSLIIPLDVHVHNTALQLGITERRSADFKTAKEITDFLLEAFPDDPCLGDFALFAYSAAKAPERKERKERKESEGQQKGKCKKTGGEDK